MPEPGAVEVALLDLDGVVVAVNEAWRAFGRAGGGDPTRTGVGASYLAACDAAGDDLAARDVAAAVRDAVRGDLPAALRVEVPCHSPAEDVWFDVLVSSRLADDGSCLGATVTLSRTAGAAPRDRSGLARLLAGVPALLEARGDLLDDVLDDLLDDLPAAALELLGARSAALTVLAQDGTVATVHRTGPAGLHEHGPGERPEALGLLGVLLSRSRPLRLADVAQHPAAGPAVGSGALLGAPVTAYGRVLGALHVVSDRPGGFTERDEALLAALAALAGTAADAARRRRSLDERQRWTELTRELAAHPVADEPALCVLVAQLAGRGTGGAATLVLTGPDGRTGTGGPDDPLVAEVLRTCSPRRGGPAPVARAAVPLSAGGLVVGALVVERTGPLTVDELRELAGLAHHAGLALQLLRATVERRALQTLRDRVALAAGTQDEAVRRLFGLAFALSGSGAADTEGPLDALDEVVELLRSSGLALRLDPDGPDAAPEPQRSVHTGRLADLPA